MDGLGFAIVPIIGGIALYFITTILVKAPGSSLQAKFAKLTRDTNGVIAGKTLMEITRVCGSPSAVSSMGNGQKLCQWQATGYHIALLFDADGVCLGVSSEIKV